MPLSVRLNWTWWAASRAMPPGPNIGCWPPGICGGFADVEVTLFHQALDNLVEQLGQLSFQVGVPIGIAGGFAAQDLEHLRCQLTRIHQGLEDGLAQGVEGPVGITVAELTPIGVLLASGEAGLE